MSYTLLGNSLHSTADRAKKWFANNYGATGFKCEEPAADGVPLTPTWTGRLANRYLIFINVQPTPFSPTLSDFINVAAQRALPVKLWVAIPQVTAKAEFNSELKRAKENGVGVVEFSDSGGAHEHQRSVPLSLFGLRRCEMTAVIKRRREAIRNAEATFLEGDPGSGCQAICQELEDVTRAFAKYTHDNGMWKCPKGAKTYKPRFFQSDSWANMLDALDKRIDTAKVRRAAPAFTRDRVAAARGYTSWRNDVSHRPKTLKAISKRDTRLRTMFEATRDLLVDWYEVAKPLKLLS